LFNFLIKYFPIIHKKIFLANPKLNLSSLIKKDVLLEALKKLAHFEFKLKQVFTKYFFISFFIGRKLFTF